MTDENKQLTLFVGDIAPIITVAKKRERIQKRIHELSEELYALVGKPGERVTIHSPLDAMNLLMGEMSALEVEELWTINMNTRNGVIAVRHIYRGSTNSSQIMMPNVFRPAILDCATSMIIAHNHPSGDPAPSPEGVAVTRAFVQAGKLMDIEIMDHVIIAGGHDISLKERGLGF